MCVCFVLRARQLLLRNFESAHNYMEEAEVEFIYIL